MNLVGRRNILPLGNMYWTSLLKRDKIDGLLFSQETQVAHWERGPFHTRQISFPPSLGTLKDTHQGTSLCPTACLATTTPCQHILCVSVCMYVCTPLSPPSPLHCVLILPQPLRSASYLTCILRGTLLTYLPTTEIQNHKGITRVNAFYYSPSWLSVRHSHWKQKGSQWQE